MWSSVVGGPAGDVPCARHKHAVCVSQPHVYLLGGRHGNLPLKDFWVYDLVTRTWREIRDDSGARPPSLQQHTMVEARDKLLVFGGELCMSNECPLWMYHPQTRMWRKWRWSGRGGGGGGVGGGGGRTGGAAGPTGRRGHTSILEGDSMLVYGGYQDLRGSSSELWAFSVVDEAWAQVSCRGEQPPPRHAHSAVLHDGQMWVYGGMTDLQERNDFWRFDIVGRTWTQIRARPNPGYLHSHIAARLHSSMIVFGGERQGEVLNELWRYHFATNTWERLMPSGIRPQPRSQFCAFVAPSHYIKGPRFFTPSAHSGFGSSSASSSSRSSSGYNSSYSQDSYKSRRIQLEDSVNSAGGTGRGGGGGGGVSEEGSCACQDCVDVEDDDLDPTRLRSLIQTKCSNAPASQLKLSISKFSQLNLSHLGRYYSYSVLSNDSTESIVEESLASTCDSVGSKIIKSQSVHHMNMEKSLKEGAKGGLTRDILSVPNFGEIKGGEDEDAGKNQMPVNHVKVITVVPAESTAEATLEDDPADLMAGIKGRLAFSQDEAIQSANTSFSENLMSFSCTTDSNLSSNTNLGSINNYNVSGPSSFTNPNYVGFDPGSDQGGLLSQDYWTTGALDLESIRHKEFAEMLRTPPDSGIGLGVEMERRTPLDVTFATLEDFVTIDNHSARFNRNTKVHPTGQDGSPTSHKPSSTAKVTFSTNNQTHNSGGSREDEETTQGGGGGEGDKPPPPRINPFMKPEPLFEPTTPTAMYIVGGKEIDQMTVFKRPISVWKLDMPF